MPRNVIPIRGSSEEHQKWKTAAGSQSFSAWARRVLNEAAEAEVAVARDRDFVKAERLDVVRSAFPQKSFRPDPK